MYKDVTFLEKEEELTVRIMHDIDHHSARRMREEIDAKLYELRPTSLVMDFSAVGFMDSSGIGLIMGRSEKAATLNISVRVCGLSATLMKLVKLCGLEKIKNLTLTK